MIQQNAITSGSHSIEARQARSRNYNTLLAILLILGVTLMLSLYVYQTSALYATQLAIQAKQHEYARHQRLNAEALILLAQTESMEAMVRRARASGYGPPGPDQIKYVRINDGAAISAQHSARTSANRD
jgi:hypothetical protein